MTSTAAPVATKHLTDLPRATWKGQRVTPDRDFPGLPSHTFGKVYKVERVNRVNVVAQPESPGERGVNFPAEAYIVLAADEQPQSAGVAVARPFQSREFFLCGEVVTLKRAYKDWGVGTPMVVLKDNGEKVNVTPLGGDGDRYLRIAGEGLVKRDLGWLTEVLVDAA